MQRDVSRWVPWIYVAAILLTFHYTLTLYINSNYLSQYFSTQNLSVLYALGASLTLILFVLSPNLIKKFGNIRLLLSAIIFEIAALLTLYTTTDIRLIALAFIFHVGLPPFLLFGLDIFLEDALKTEKFTGRVRSLYLTAINGVFVITPLIVGNIVTFGSYRLLYLISALFCVLLFFVVGDELRKFKTHSLHQISFTDSVRKILPRQGLRIVILLDFLLQSFYVLMIIYMPLYLHQTIGFDWETIGILFTIMLLPFVLFEAPLGRIFDHKKIEIDTLVVGFVILILSLVIMTELQSPSFLAWALVLFVSRIGASFVEVSSEYAFFRRVTGRDAGFISFFRMTVPLSFIIVPLIAEAFLPFMTIPSLLLIYSIVLLLGVLYSLRLRRAKQ